MGAGACGESAAMGQDFGYPVSRLTMLVGSNRYGLLTLTTGLRPAWRT